MLANLESDSLGSAFSESRQQRVDDGTRPSRRAMIAVPMAPRIVVLGAGFGGLELSSVCQTSSVADAGVTFVRQGRFVHVGYSKLEVLFGPGRADQGAGRGTRRPRPLLRASDKPGSLTWELNPCSYR